MELSEKELKLFKTWLKGMLRSGKVTVTFTKKDGTERVMDCTTSSTLVPAEPVVEGAAPKREKKPNDDVCSVYDLEANGWRSFRWDSIKQVRLEL